jgi:hypothetical protein
MLQKDRELKKNNWIQSNNLEIKQEVTDIKN